MARANASFLGPDVRVTNLAQAIQFFRRLGLRPVARGRMADGTSVVWMRDPTTNHSLELFRLASGSPIYRPFRPERSTNSALIFLVRDLELVLRRLRAHGARPETEFTDRSARLVFLRGPGGCRIELIAPHPPRARPRRRPGRLRRPSDGTTPIRRGRGPPRSSRARAGRSSGSGASARGGPGRSRSPS